MSKMNNQERAMIFDDLLEDLSRWDWTDNFDMSQLEGEAVLYLLERWKVRRDYFKQRYKEHSEEYKIGAKKRYRKNQDEIKRRRREKLHDKL